MHQSQTQREPNRHNGNKAEDESIASKLVSELEGKVVHEARPPVDVPPFRIRK